MAKERIITKDIEIKVLTHRDTGMLAAYSPDLKGLLVMGRSEEDIARDLPGAVREILEAQGKQVVTVEATKKTGEPLGEWAPAAFVASARLAAA
jgi:hypothetical protein